MIEGNCITALPRLHRTNLPDLVFVSPPAYDPALPMAVSEEQYKYNIRTATMLSWKVCQGVMVLHGGDHLVGIWMDLAEKLGMTQVKWLNWLYDFGKNDRHNFNDSRTHLLVYAKDPENYPRNVEAVQVRKKGSRATRTPGCVWGIEADGQNWGRITKTSKEYVPYACGVQLPENLLARIIKFYSNPGDTVMTPYSGAGTTAVVAVELSRSVVAIDPDTDATEYRIKRGAVRAFEA